VAEATDFAFLAAPARRALAREGIARLPDLTKWTEHELSKLHGMGPNALRLLRERLAQHGLGFAPGDPR
jgi:hypothetical protein